MTKHGPFKAGRVQPGNQNPLSTTDTRINTDSAMVSGEKRRRAAAVQDLTEMRDGPANAKRLGVRQLSGALAGDATAAGSRLQPHSEFRRGNGLFSGIHFGMDDGGKSRLNV
jgi:hypothetical protein